MTERTTRPRRIQRKRTKGWRMPEEAVYVGRPGRWGNPFQTGSNQPTVFVHDGLRVLLEIPRSDDAWLSVKAEAVRLFRIWMIEPDRLQMGGRHWWSRAEIWRTLPDLSGRDLACWCPLYAPCHADVLLELANS